MVCRFFVGAVGAAFLAPLVGCTYLVDPGSLQPRPNVLLNASTQTLALDLPEAPEKVSVALPYHGHGLEIHDWRRGLADGFREAFKKYFRIVPASAAPDWTLNIVKAKPTLAPTSLGRDVTLVAEITFQATLMRAGALPRPLAATVTARRPLVFLDATESIQSAIEVMYEQIAERLFTQPRGV